MLGGGQCPGGPRTSCLPLPTVLPEAVRGLRLIPGHTALVAPSPAWCPPLGGWEVEAGPAPFLPSPFLPGHPPKGCPASFWQDTQGCLDPA